MGISNKDKELFNKFIERRISETELDSLSSLLKDPDKAILFKEMTRDHYLINTWRKKFDSTIPLKKALNEIQQEKTNRFSKEIWKYAATILLILGFASYLYFSLNQKYSDTKGIVPTNNLVELVLSNGKKVLITTNYKDTIKETSTGMLGVLNKGQLHYIGNNKPDTSYNTLKIPYGKKFTVVLADGTKAHLNAGSTLKYPINFVEDQTREVFLNGEAYFEVVHDLNRKFIVNTDKIGIEVLGTKFNVSSYQNDASITTTLVSGSVLVRGKSDSFQYTVLKPKEQSIWEKENHQLNTFTVNPQDYTSWIHNELHFIQEPFESIAKKLERSYDVSITGHNIILGREKFTAKFKNETIEQIIGYFSDAYGFEYKIDTNRNITIMSK